MNVFIENEADSKLKNLFDEKKLEYKDSFNVARAYPYPYGFIINTEGEDGDNIDVFVLTDKKLKTGDIIEVEIVGLMEQFEKSWGKDKEKEEIDHNIIAKLIGDKSFIYNDQVKSKLKEFVLHIFDNIRINKTRVDKFHGKEKAIEFINSNSDFPIECL